MRKKKVGAFKGPLHYLFIYVDVEGRGGIQKARKVMIILPLEYVLDKERSNSDV